MNRRITLTLAIVGLLAANFANAQVIQASNSTTIADVKGSPYLNESFEDGVILFSNNTRKAPIRYNAYKDLIEYNHNGSSMSVDPAKTVKKVQFGESTFVVEKFEANDGNERYGYFALLDSGKVNLYAKRKVKFDAGGKGRALDGGDQPAEFRRQPDAYFLKIGENPITEFRTVKALIAALPDKQVEMTTYAKKEKISLREEKELVQLVEYYNSL